MEIDKNIIAGAYHLADNPQLYEPQRSNNFELQVTGIDNLPGITQTALDTDENNLTNASSILRLSVVSTSIPQFTQEVIEVPYGNNRIKFAGVPKFDQTSLKINDFIGARSKEIVQAWQRLSYNARNQKVGLAKDYKKTAYLVEYTPDYEVVRTWKIVGCWVSSIKYGDFSYEENSKKVVDCEIAYDYAYPEE